MLNLHKYAKKVKFAENTKLNFSQNIKLNCAQNKNMKIGTK